MREPKCIQATEDLSSAIHISSGSHHSALVTKGGELFVCGSALHGKLGIKNLSCSNVTKFTKVPALRDESIVQVECGDYHTLALNKRGEVFSWGGSLHKKAAGGCEPYIVKELASAGVKVVQIGCGDFHSMALDIQGRVFTWGGGGSSYNKGQLGHGHLNDVEKPMQVTTLSEYKITNIAAGGYHCLALSQENELFAWGSGMYGECGHG